MEIKFKSFMLKSDYVQAAELPEDQWLIQETEDGKFKVMSDKAFQEKYVEFNVEQEE